MCVDIARPTLDGIAEGFLRLIQPPLRLQRTRQHQPGFGRLQTQRDRLAGGHFSLRYATEVALRCCEVVPGDTVTRRQPELLADPLDVGGARVHRRSIPKATFCPWAGSLLMG
jgi:hypothetical protein